MALGAYGAAARSLNPSARSTLTCATLAHNLYRWINRHAPGCRRGQLTAAHTVRGQLLALPGRLVNRSGRTLLCLPAHWPWAATFHSALTNIRALPQLC